MDKYKIFVDKKDVGVIKITNPHTFMGLEQKAKKFLPKDVNEFDISIDPIKKEIHLEIIK